MRYAPFSPLRYAIPVVLLAAGAMAFVPGDNSERAASVNEIAPRELPSYLAASPELVEELNAALVPAKVEEPVLAREASLPDPSALETNPAVPSAAQMAALDETVTESEIEAPALRVGDSAVNMRAGPSTSTAVIRALQPGEQLSYGEANGGWVSVTTEAGETGWVYGTYLTGPAMQGMGGGEDRQVASAEPLAEPAKPRAEQGSEPEGRYARVGSDVYLRAGPSTSTERLFVLPAGERVKVAETRGRWARVILPSGASGWVRVR